MKAKNMTTAMLVIGAMWAMAACSGNPLGPERVDNLNDVPEARQTFPDGAATPTPRMPQLPLDQENYRPRQKAQ